MIKDTVLTNAGKLRKRLLPAVYFDTSVLVDYWLTEGMEMPMTEIDKLGKENDPLSQVVRDILKSEERINKVVEIRKKLLFEDVRVTPVVSPLCLLELIEWHAEHGFRQIASDASGTMYIRSKSKKQIGDYLKKALERRETEVREQKVRNHGGGSTGLESLMDATWLNGSFAMANGLHGLLSVDIVSFHLPISTVWGEPFAYAYLQLGIADILHILLAQHLGCQYIASFDSDFERVKDIIREETGISILTKPEEILNIF